MDEKGSLEGGRESSGLPEISSDMRCLSLWPNSDNSPGCWWRSLSLVYFSQEAIFTNQHSFGYLKIYYISARLLY